MFKKKKISKAKIVCRGSCRRRRWLINAIRVFQRISAEWDRKVLENCASQKDLGGGFFPVKKLPN